MGKKRTRDQEEITEHGHPKKKHKKNKHHHKSKQHRDKPVPPIKLKIKLGDKYISTKGDGFLQDDTSSLAESEHLSLGDQSAGGAEEWEGSDISVGKDDYSNEVVPSNENPNEDDQEEEAWLNALESGNVDERGYLPSKSKSSGLTARQRAMLGGESRESSSEQLMELPFTKKVGEVITEEDILKKVEKTQKRRLAAHKRKEKRKAETVRKLIEKQSTKKKDDKPHKVSMNHTHPHVRYITSTRPLVQTTSTKDSPTHIHSLLSLPVGMDYPIPQQHATRLSPTLCAVKTCSQPKKYSDSATKQPLCSLECYNQFRTDTSSTQET